MARNLVCSECGGTMQIGWIPKSYSRQLPEGTMYWISGTPKREHFEDIFGKGKQRFDVVAYRCESCGLLKFYAGPDLFPEPKS